MQYYQISKAMLCAFAFITCVFFAGVNIPTERWFQAKVFEYLMHTVPSNLVIVEIDAKSIDAVGAWPWKRSMHAEVLTKIASAKPKQVFVDIDFSASSTAREDAILVESLSALSAVSELMLPVFIQNESVSSTKKIISKPSNFVLRNVNYVSVNLQMEKMGAVRYFSPGFEYQSVFYPLAAAALSDVESSGGNINFAIDPASFTYLSYIDVLEGKVDLSLFDGKSVLLGATAVDLGDNIPVPLHGFLPGVVVQALIAETINGGGLTEMSNAWMLILLFLLIFISCSLFSFLPWKIGGALIPVLWVFWVCASATIGYLLQKIFPVPLPLLAITVSYITITIFKYDKNIFETIELQIQLKFIDSLLLNILSTSNDCIICVDSNGDILKASNKYIQLIDQPSEAIEKKNISNYLPGLDYDNYGSDVEPVDTNLHMDNGEYIPVEVSFTKIAFKSYFAYTTILVRDLRKRIAREKALEYQSLHDELTGLPNRAYLFKVLDEHLSAKKGLTIFLIDLSFFKQVNDYYGHQIGDRLLQAVSKRLQQLLLKDMQCFRLGGDEFVCLFDSQFTALYAQNTAGAVIDALSAPYAVEHAQIEISASIGIADSSAEDITVMNIVKQADLALYHAKKNFMAIAYYEKSMSHSAMRQIELLPQLRHAMKEDELYFVYQPKIDLNTMSVYGVEVLSRWKNKNNDYIPPSEFIEVAENTRLIMPLTLYLCESLLKSEAIWKQNNLPSKISFNLSVRLLENIDTIREICALLDNSINYFDFEFEITESSVMESIERTNASVRTITDAGYKISIDDYGTGHSSLAYLANLNATTLKIDRSFVNKCNINESNNIIIRSTISMAHELGLVVVAEGIENKEEARVLKQANCDVAQGFFYGKPMVLTDFIDWYVEWENSRLAQQTFEIASNRNIAI